MPENSAVFYLIILNFISNLKLGNFIFIIYENTRGKI